MPSVRDFPDSRHSLPVRALPTVSYIREIALPDFDEFTGNDFSATPADR
jgi:hypothetical protein